ncbi:MAG: acetylglutamate kinase [Pseudomonadota bacterium]
MNRDGITIARTLSETLPYLQRHDRARVVIKVGGNVIGDDAALAGFARDVVLLRQVGLHTVIVHGGGPMINELLKRLGVEAKFVNGKRVTDAATVEIVEMVLAGQVNKRIVQAINREGGCSVGLSGKDADMIVCDPADPKLGFVGEPVEVRTDMLIQMIEARIIPVIAPIGAGRSGETFNINGDTAAGAIAASLQADRLLLLTDVAGVRDETGTIATELTVRRIRELTEAGVIAGGMIPKTETCVQALRQGVRAAVILDGRAPNACLLELFTENGTGSVIHLE